MKWRKIELTDSAFQELLKAEKEVKKPQLLKRIQCIKLKNSNWKNVELADFFIVDEHTVTSWLKAYCEQGLSGLLKWNYKGKSSSLTNEQQKELQQRNKEKPFKSAKEAKGYILDNYGHNFHLHWVQKLLKKNFNCHMKK